MTCWQTAVQCVSVNIISLKHGGQNEAWVHEVCDFIWVFMQENRDYWQPEINRLWPGVRFIMDEQNVEDTFSQLHF